MWITMEYLSLVVQFNFIYTESVTIKIVSRCFIETKSLTPTPNKQEGQEKTLWRTTGPYVGYPSANGLVWYRGVCTVSLKLNYLLKFLFEFCDEDAEFVHGYVHLSPVNYLLGCLLLHQSRLIGQRDQEHILQTERLTALNNWGWCEMGGGG